MILPSIYYFLYYAAISFLYPYLALFYQGQGLSGGQIGLLAAILPLIAFFGAPLWTGTADAIHRHKAAAVIAILGAATIALILPGVATFAGLILAVGLLAFFMSPIGSLTDSAILSLLGERKEKYGRVRLWGTLGYGVVAPLAGELIGRFGLQWAFWGYAILMVVGLLIVIPIPFRQSRSSGSFLGGMRNLFANQPWMLFLVMVFIGGVGMATINNYLFIYMQSLGASKALMGVALMVSTASEIPALFFGNHFLRRFGARGLLIIAMATIGLRLICYSLTTLFWVVLLIQLVHGLTFAIILIAGVSYADQVAPAGMKATTQGMFSGTLMGFGAATGGLLGGVLMERFQPAGMYGIVGAIVLVSLVAFLFIERKLVRRTG
jgi:MFS transporter, PPP family, 3-phenylpropionic acid transporter